MSLVWMHITEQKIINQSRILNANGHNEESKMLYEYSKNVTPGDKSNREGHAAKVYFNTLFGKDFCRSDDNQINACLNYGYSIILSAFNRELCNLGYVTELGIFHNNIRNPFNLACDLMEPFRQVVDKFVVQNSPVTLTTETKHELVKLLDEEVEINGRKEYLQRAIQIYTKSITDALTLNDVSIIKFYNYEW